MAGKFVSLEEAARLLGVSVDEVNRLVDRKKLFPMRDGATVKFKADDIDRYRASAGDDSSVSDALALDLDLPASGDGDLELGEPIDDGDVDLGLGSVVGGDMAGQTIVRGGADAAADDLALGDDAGSLLTGDDDLALESLIGASSPSLAEPAGAQPDAGSSIGDSGLTLDLDRPPPGSAATGSLALGSVAGLSGPSGAGASLSGPLDSGLSLEVGGDLGEVAAASGIDFAAGDADLGGDAFELGADAGDEESASVVIATDETGDSSFFGAALDDSASVAIEDSSLTDSSSMLGAMPFEPPVETTFSVWQIVGLACCTLLMLAGGLLLFDLAWTLRAPQGQPVSTPLLTALASAFGW